MKRTRKQPVWALRWVLGWALAAPDMLCTAGSVSGQDVAPARGASAEAPTAEAPTAEAPSGVYARVIVDRIELR